MDIGINSNLVPDEGGTILFNQEFDPSTGLPVSSGGVMLFVQGITGMDGAGIRNPTTNRPHKDGALIHQFRREARIFTIEGVLLSDNVTDRWDAADFIRGVTERAINNDARYNFTPSDPALDDRYLTVRLYEPVDLSQMNNGEAGPKSFTMTFIAGDPRAYSDEGQVSIHQSSGTATLIENNGNTDAWLTFTVHTNRTVDNFRLQNQDTLFEIVWDGTDLPFTLDASHTTGDIDMLNEDFFQANQHNLIGGINLIESDFFPITPGGDIVGFDGDIGDLGSTYITVDVRSAWV